MGLELGVKVISHVSGQESGLDNVLIVNVRSLELKDKIRSQVR